MGSHGRRTVAVPMAVTMTVAVTMTAAMAVAVTMALHFQSLTGARGGFGGDGGGGHGARRCRGNGHDAGQGGKEGSTVHGHVSFLLLRDVDLREAWTRIE